MVCTKPRRCDVLDMFEDNQVARFGGKRQEYRGVAGGQRGAWVLGLQVRWRAIGGHGGHGWRPVGLHFALLAVGSSWKPGTRAVS